MNQGEAGLHELQSCCSGLLEFIHPRLVGREIKRQPRILTTTQSHKCFSAQFWQLHYEFGDFSDRVRCVLLLMKTARSPKAEINTNPNKGIFSYHSAYFAVAILFVTALDLSAKSSVSLCGHCLWSGDVSLLARNEIQGGE